MREEFEKIMEWVEQTAQRFHAEQREQEESRDFGTFIIRVVMAPEPLHPEYLHVTVYEDKKE